MGQVRIYTSGDAETDAYIMCRYSRSLASVDTYIREVESLQVDQAFQAAKESLRNSGYSLDGDLTDAEERLVWAVVESMRSLNNPKAKKAHRNYTINYKHKSIAECGSLSVYFEGIPMFLEPYIQHSMQYKGIASSTRYIDYSNGSEAKVVKDFLCEGSNAGDVYVVGQTEIHAKRMISNYSEKLDEFYRKFLQEEFNRPEGISDKAWQKACMARATDKARGFLSAATLTNIGYHGTLMEIAELMNRLPVSTEHGYEMGLTSRPIIEGLIKVRERLQEEILRVDLGIILDSDVMAPPYALQGYYYEVEPEIDSEKTVVLSGKDLFNDTFYSLKNSLDRITMGSDFDVENPTIRNLGPRFEFLIRCDYAGYREMHRHRLLMFSTPEISWGWPMKLNPFYDESPRIEVHGNLTTFKIGNDVTFKVSGTLGAFVYFCRTRGGETVHPTVRAVAHQIQSILQDQIKGSVFDGEEFIINFKPIKESYAETSIRRGAQDIQRNDAEKKEE